MDLNFVFGIVGVLGTVVGVVGFYLYVRDRRRVELRYEFINDTLIGDDVKPLPQQIEIRFDGRPLSNLKKTNLVMWNNGTQSVRAVDVAGQVRLSFPKGAEVFSSRIARQSVPENRASVSAHVPTDIAIAFDYLSVGQGINVEVLYSCSVGKPSVSVTLIENPRGLVDNKDGEAKTWLGRTFPVSAVAYLCIVLIGVLLVYFEWTSASPWIIVILAALPAPVILITGSASRRRREGKPIPAAVML